MVHVSVWLLQSSPSIVAAGAAGIRFERIAAFPFISSSESLEVAWLQHSLSSRPVCLATACANLFTCCSAVLCQPPRDSKAIGMKDTPCRAQSSAAPLIFRSKATLRLCPGVTAASATVACRKGLMTVTSNAASRPSAQLGRWVYPFFSSSFILGHFISEYLIWQADYTKW